MKTKHVKNTGQMVTRGNWKITKGGQMEQIARGQRRQIARGQRKQKIAQGGHCPSCPIAIVRP